MVVDDLDVPGFAITPYETDPPLVVDANAVLLFPITSQALQAVARREPQIVQAGGRIEHSQFSERCALEIGRPLPDR